MNVKEGESLKCNNLISFRGIIYPSDLDLIGPDMEEYVNSKGAKRVGCPIMATFNEEDNGMIDVEILLQIDKKIDSNNKFKFKERLYLYNCLLITHTGNPNNITETLNELNAYIIKKHYIPISVGYNITSVLDRLDIDKTEIQIYVSINPNIT